MLLSPSFSVYGLSSTFNVDGIIYILIAGKDVEDVIN